MKKLLRKMGKLLTMASIYSILMPLEATAESIK